MLENGFVGLFIQEQEILEYYRKKKYKRDKGQSNNQG
jgi:hypothetical protein